MPNEELVEYQRLVARVQALSRVQVRQFLGTRPEDDPRLVYLAQRECYLTLLIFQVQALTELLAPETRQKFMTAMLKLVRKAVGDWGKDLGVKDWSTDGQPIFELPVFREKTRGWPR